LKSVYLIVIVFDVLMALRYNFSFILTYDMLLAHAWERCQLKYFLAIKDVLL